MFILFNDGWWNNYGSTTALLLQMVLQIQFHFHITLLLTVLRFSDAHPSIIMMVTTLNSPFFSQSDGQGTLLAPASSGQSWPSILRSELCTCLLAIKSTKEKGMGSAYGRIRSMFALPTWFQQSICLMFCPF